MTVRGQVLQLWRRASARPSDERARRWLGRQWLRARWLATERHQRNQIVVEQIDGMDILVAPTVFNPRLCRTGELFARLLDHRLVRPGARVLDMGTGSGICAVRAAMLGAEVTAVDLNPEAVRCARANAVLNGVEDRMRVVEGDLFAPVIGRQFDLVLFNLPFLPGEPHDDFDRAFRGLDVVDRFAKRLGSHLRPGGGALILLSSDGDVEHCLGAFRRTGYTLSTVFERDLVNEIVTIYRVGQE